MIDFSIISREICEQAPHFGFLDAAITHIQINEQSQSRFLAWLAKHFQGTMGYLEKNTHLRFNPQLLHNGTLSIICVKAPYLDVTVDTHKERLKAMDMAYISAYALGRDYHKVLRQKLNLYANWINDYLKQYNLEHKYRVFTDSAPVLEVELATKAGLGFRGKNTLLLNKAQGSMFFLGEIFTNLPLVSGTAVPAHCGSCTKCLDICPTKAFVSPYVLDARKCISYLTIENKGSIPLEYRRAIGNRIYGCDDCQLFCPWNKFNKLTSIADFKARPILKHLSLIDAFNLGEEDWEQIMRGSPIYRIGYECWLRNVAVALGNCNNTPETVSALRSKLNFPSPLVQEHITWALENLALA